MSPSGKQDDPTIADDDRLLRRIFPDWWVPDEKASGMRLSTAAFDDYPDGSPMSVHLGSVLERLGLPNESVLRGHEGYGLAELSAGTVRSLGQGIVRMPEPDWPAHAGVVGRKTYSVQKKLRQDAILLVPPKSFP